MSKYFFISYSHIAPKEIVNEILYWTNGQPFLTQKLCYEIVEKEDSLTNIRETVEKYVNVLFFNCPVEHVHFIDIQNRIKNEKTCDYNVAMLNIYQEILRKNIALDASFSPDGTKILTVSDNHIAKLWDLKGNVLANLNKPKDNINSAIFSPDGSKILVISNDSAKLWDLEGKVLAGWKHTDKED